jgi:hypothetical protein
MPPALRNAPATTSSVGAGPAPSGSHERRACTAPCTRNPGSEAQAEPHWADRPGATPSMERAKRPWRRCMDVAILARRRRGCQPWDDGVCRDRGRFSWRWQKTVPSAGHRRQLPQPRYPSNSSSPCRGGDRAAASSGTSADRPSDPSTFRIDSGSWIAASNRLGPPHRGHTKTSIRNTRRSSSAHG